MTNIWANIGKFLFGEPARKAVSGPGVLSMTYDPPLSSIANTPQRKAAQFLRAYRVGWFYKAESRIAGDIASLDWHVSIGDDESGEEQDTLPMPDLYVPFEQLSPIEQFMRLMERPNPYQTGRQLREKTQIRLDMAGWTFLYLEGGAGGALPSAIYGISPTRMWPSYDRQGQLLGWVMDADQPSGGVPFDTDEIICLSLGSDEDGPFGVGVVEPVAAQVPLTDLMARHQADVLTTGGRLAGMLSPKDRALNEDEYQDIVRSWRNVASDPHAARRLLVFPEPMEWTSGAAKPEEIGIPELAVLNRDEILSAFPVSPYMLGVPMPGGLNSGELRKQEQRAYWEGTIHPRVDLWEEAIKVKLLSRYEQATGETYDFDFEEPDLDDAAGLVEKAAAIQALLDLGFEPESAIEAVGLDHIKWNGVPEPEPLPEPMLAEMPQPEELPPPATRSAKAKRDDLLDQATARARADLERFLREQRDRLADNIRASFPAKSRRAEWAAKANPDWWNDDVENYELRKALRGTYVALTRGGLQVVADRLDRFVLPLFIRNVLRAVEEMGGERIVGINETTRKAVQDIVAEGVRRGYSVSQVVDGVPAEGFGGMNGLAVFNDARAEMIARTESRLAFNQSNILGYKEYGVELLEASDGDEDEVCAARNGQVMTVDEALAEDEAEHPNGTLAWDPVIDKSYHAPAPAPSPVVQNFYMGPDGVKSLDTLTPIVNVAPPDLSPIGAVVDEVKALREDVEKLKVPAPVVNVPPPIVTVDNVRVTAMPERIHSLTRDAAGKPIGSVETDA